MQDICAVDVFQAAQDLVNEGLEMGVSQRLTRADDCGQVTLHKFYVQIGLVEVVRPWNVHVVQTYNVPVPAEVPQQLDLAQSALGQDLLAENISDLLDSHPFIRLVVGRRAHDSIRPLSKLFRHGVALVYHEVLVEDFEHLSALEILLTHG